MWNPFKNEKEEVRNTQSEQANYELSAATLSNPQSTMDEQAMQERREVLVQLTQWQQDRSPAMQKLFLQLAGYEFNNDKDKIIPQAWNEGYCNLIGSAKLVNYIEGLDHNVMLGSWDDKNLILTLRESIAHPLRRFIFSNHKELGIEINHAEYTFWIVMNCIEPTYWRGYKDGERRKDREIIKVNELRNPYYQQKKKGLFGVEA